MPGWVLWVVLACAFGVGEMLSGGFFLAPFALGAALAAAGDAVAGGTAGVIVFLVASVMSLALLRPIVRAHVKMPPAIRTGSAALIGKPAIVLERIANAEGVGIVKIDGEVWTARSLYDDHEIEPGARVEVVDIKGATALVSE
ncbi:MAG TPA: NfeD family protein [Solirubrobacteraceae bacterium]|nr:NfeD family protein [Solirubrobacteraceae bacterium]